MLGYDGIVSSGFRISESSTDVLGVFVTVDAGVVGAYLLHVGLLDLCGDILRLNVGAGNGENLDCLLAIQILKPLRDVIPGTLHSGNSPVCIWILGTDHLVDDVPSQGPTWNSKDNIDTAVKARYFLLKAHSL